MKMKKGTSCSGRCLGVITTPPQFQDSKQTMLGPDDIMTLNFYISGLPLPPKLLLMLVAAGLSSNNLL